MIKTGSNSSDGFQVSAGTNASETPLTGRRVALVGKLGGMARREALTLLRQHGAIPAEVEHEGVTTVVLGAEALPVDLAETLPKRVLDAASAGQVEIISETELWERLELAGESISEKQLYTPAMLAQLLDVPLAIIRRWHRRGLITPTREVFKLPYFDFQEVVTARRLAEMLEAGASPKEIETRLAQLSELLPEIDRPLNQLSVIVEGRHLLLRHGEGLIDSTGQRRFDFEATEAEPIATIPSTAIEPPTVKPTVALSEHSHDTAEELLRQAAEFEDAGQLEAALDMYRASLFVTGPNAEIHFLLAELLYRVGDVTAARERYYAALEVDEDYVEARANLGCVLVETGQPELAVAAFRGALERHEDYPDVHFHLARTLDDLGRADEAQHHWLAFLDSAPDSPWSQEARDRLGLSR